MATALKVIFAGTPEFAAVSLQALLDSEHSVVAVYTQPDRPAGRGRRLTASPVKQLALQHQITVRQPATLRDAAVHQELAQWQADVMVVAAYGLILPAAVLGIPRLGCINVHASLLPRWRGAAPIQRAILAGDQETGITIMQMDAGLDTGDMLRVASCPIGRHDTAQILHDRLASLGAEALLDTLTQVAASHARPVAQDDSLATYASKLDKSEARLDWSRSAPTLDRQVRAFNPWPVAFTTLPGGEHLRIWQAEPLMESASGAEPGNVIAQDKQGIDVAAGQGVLRITHLQLPGGKPLNAAEFGNAHNLLGQQLQ